METKQQFKIYKEGTTAEQITIVSKVGENFDRQKKIDFYKSLGYTVYSLEGKQI